MKLTYDGMYTVCSLLPVMARCLLRSRRIANDIKGPISKKSTALANFTIYFSWWHS